MKNLFVYLHPTKSFTSEVESLTKIQIDNSLTLGWKREDILLVTNFDYEYNGVKAIVVDDKNFCEFRPTSSKINVILTFFESGVIENDLYWFHDLDAFQLEEMIDPNLSSADMGLTAFDERPMAPEYLGAHRWNGGVIFFKKEARDIFEQIKEQMYRRKVIDETALVRVELKAKRGNSTFLDRIKILNVTYNFVVTPNLDLTYCYEVAEKPLKIIHFRPFDKRKLDGDIGNLDFCVRGQNKMGKVLLSENLINLFNKYGIK